MYSSVSQPVLMHSSLRSVLNFSFLPYDTNSAEWLKGLKRHLPDDSDGT